mmetsp:Transcript_119963/g.233518  ORF Transcript_119963/g.233518 Transcript_119963/m.233518 type:complete len:1330 (-) Transcript_119963:135-4124(-)
MFASRGARLSKESSIAAAPTKVALRSAPAQVWDGEEAEASSAQSEPSSGPMSARSTGLSADEREPATETRAGRSLARECDARASSSKDRRTAVSPFRSLPDLHPHEVELRVAVKDLSREVAPEKFRSRTKGVGGFVFGLLVFPQGTKSAPEHARKNRPAREGEKNGEQQEEEKSVAVVAVREKKETRWISAFVEARPTEDYPPHWYFEDVQFLVSLINFEDLKKSIVKHDKHTFSPVESSDGKAIDRGWHDFVHCDEATLRNNGFVDPKDDTVCFRASVYLAGGAMKVSPKTKSRYMSLSKIELSGPYEKVPNFLSSLVQLWYHIGHFRGVVYGAGGGTCALPAGGGQKRVSCVLGALREVFVRLQAKSPPASCSALCAAFGRRMWSRICEAEPDAFCWEVFHALEAELAANPDGSKTEEVRASAKKEVKAGKAGRGGMAKVDGPVQDQKVLWETVRELFEFEVEWVAQSIEGGDFSDSSVFQGPVFTFVVRGFSTLEATLDHYFSPKIIEDGSGVRVRTTRRFRRLPHVLQWYLKRGDYDCCTGLCGLTDTFLGFPRQIDMSRYCEGSGVYNLYGVMVESDEHYWSYIRPEMEGDQGQWYRFDDRETSTCAMSNATAIDASFGGEEWLCVNYLYGPSAVLTRPKESRACLLVYLKESAMDVLLHEPRLPKISRDYHQSTGMQRDGPTRAVEAEAAAAAAQALLEEVEAQAMKEEKKRKQKQKKKQKEKERRSQARSEETLCDGQGEEPKSDGKTSPVECMSDDDMPLPLPSKSQQEVLAALGKRRNGSGVAWRDSSPDVESKGFEENHRAKVTRRQKGSAKVEEKIPVEVCSPAQSTSATRPQTPSQRTADTMREASAERQRAHRASCSSPVRDPPPDSRGFTDKRQETPLRESDVASSQRECPTPTEGGSSGSSGSRAANNNGGGCLEEASTPTGSVHVSRGSATLPTERQEVSSPSKPARQPKVAVFPEQLVSQDDSGALGEYAQFVCKICNLVVRSPLVLPCAHMFCSICFNQWVQQKRPNVMCPTCKQAVLRQEVVHFEGRSSAGALALLHRLYSGMKVRCVYHPELSGTKPQMAEVERARVAGLSCSWRGSMHDYASHLGVCKVHASVLTTMDAPGLGTAVSSTQCDDIRPPPVSPSQPAPGGGGPRTAVRLPSSAPSAAHPSRSEQSWTHITGAFQALAPWHSQEAGALCVKQGAALWVTSTDESGEWAYARLLQVSLGSHVGAGEGPPPAWVPRALLQRAVYPACSVFDAQGQAQGLSLNLGDFVHVYHREASGWTYGARLERRPQTSAATADGSSSQRPQRTEEIGWFPEACITEPLPVA